MGRKSDELGGCLIYTMLWCARDCITLMAEWAGVLSWKQHQLPFCQYYNLTIEICSINHSSTCTWNSLSVVFPSSSDSLWIRFCLSNKMISIIFTLGGLLQVKLSDNFVLHSALWHFVSRSYWNTQNLSPVRVQLRMHRVVWHV